jgi:hypothetical protein
MFFGKPKTTPKFHDSSSAAVMLVDKVEQIDADTAELAW